MRAVNSTSCYPALHCRAFSERTSKDILVFFFSHKSHLFETHAVQDANPAMSDLEGLEFPDLSPLIRSRKSHSSVMYKSFVYACVLYTERETFGPHMCVCNMWRAASPCMDEAITCRRYYPLMKGVFSVSLTVTHSGDLFVFSSVPH